MTYHQALLAEYQALRLAEDRLEWLVERTPKYSPLESEFLVEEYLVRECVSPLWLKPGMESEHCVFRARAHSRVVQGVVLFLCDLASGRTPEELLRGGIDFLPTLGLESLLGITRRMTVERVMNEIQRYASHIHGESRGEGGSI